MRWMFIFRFTGMALLLFGCGTEPSAPAPPRTIKEQIAAWNPRIIVEEQIGGVSPSWNLQTITPGDTICAGVARFSIDSLSKPDSVVWTLGQRVFTTTRFATTNIPRGTQTIRALIRKRFYSEVEGRDTTIERNIERTFVSLDESYSLTIGKWVPVNSSDQRIDTLRVLYQEIIPGLGEGLRNYVLGTSRGCDSASTFTSMVMILRRYAVNFERKGDGRRCGFLIGELTLTSPTRGLYRYRNDFPTRPTLDSILVRRVQ